MGVMSVVRMNSQMNGLIGRIYEHERQILHCARSVAETGKSNDNQTDEDA